MLLLVPESPYFLAMKYGDVEASRKRLVENKQFCL